MKAVDVLTELKAWLKRDFGATDIEIHFEPELPTDAGPVLRPDCLVKAVVRGKTYTFIVEVKTQIARSHVQVTLRWLREYQKALPGAVPLFVAPYLASSMIALFKDQGIACLDLCGNYFFAGADPKSRDNFSTRFPVVLKTPFGDRCTLILRYLLSKKPPKGYVKEIAINTGLQPGLVSKVAKIIDQSKFGLKRDGSLEITDRDFLLQEWKNYYLRNPNRPSIYVGPKRNDTILEALRKAARDGRGYGVTSPAARALRQGSVPTVWHIHAPERSFQEYLVADLSLEPMDGHPERRWTDPSAQQIPKIVIFDPIYRDSVLWGAELVNGIRVVSPLQEELDGAIREFDSMGARNLRVPAANSQSVAAASSSPGREELLSRAVEAFGALSDAELRKLIASLARRQGRRS